MAGIADFAKRVVCLAALFALAAVLFSCSEKSGPTAPASRSYKLTLDCSPANGGTVSRSPNKTAYASGDTVTIVAIPADGYRFLAWDGISIPKDTLKIVMDGDKTITANFEQKIDLPPDTYTLTIIASPADGGFVSRDPDKTAYATGDVVKLTAVAAPGYSFYMWDLCDEMLGSNGYTFVNIRIGNRNAVIQVNFIPMEIPPTTVTIDMVSVQGGTFTMGCTADQGDGCYTSEGEPPTQIVTLNNYQISKYVITQKQWKTVMEGTGYDYSQAVVGDSFPQEGGSWDVVVNQFLPRLNAMTGKNYRLPTEAEWEYAARGGASSRGYKYSGSNTIDDVAWYADNSNRSYHQVGTKAPNELGIYDMSGNISEWVSDWYGSYSSSPQINPAGPSSGTYKVLRGGAVYYESKYMYVACRAMDEPQYGTGKGIRLALSADSK